MTVSLTAIVRELAEKLYPGRVVKGTTTGGSSTTAIIDTNSLANTNGHVNQYDGVLVRIDEKVGSGPAIGTYRRINDAGYDGANSKVTVAAFATAVEAGTDFSLHRTLRPTELEAAANSILSQAYHRAFHPLSVITNYDYETLSGTAPASWTPSDPGTPKPTATRVTDADRVSYGRYAMRAVNAQANQYMQSVSVAVAEGQEWFAWAPVSGGVGTAELSVWDVTNNVEIQKAVTAAIVRSELYFTFTVPSLCKQVAIRLRGVQATADIYWGPVVLLPALETLVDLPSWFTTPEQLMGAVYLPLGTGRPGSGEVSSYASLEGGVQELLYRPEFHPVDANPRRIALTLPSSGPAFVRAWRPFAELVEASGASGASPTTEMEHDTLLQGCLGICHKSIARRLSNSDTSRAAQHQAWSQEAFDAYAELLRKNDYAIPETEVLLPRVVPVRLR